MCRPPYLPPPTLTCHHPPSLCPPLSPFAHLPPSCPSAHPFRPPALFVAWPLTCDHCHGPHLHAHLPSPALPSCLTPCHSHNMVITDHPRCAIVAEAAPHQPPVMHPCAGTHLSHSILDPTLSPSRTWFQFHLGKDRGSGTCGGSRVGVPTGRGRGTGMETCIPLGGM